VENAPRLRDVIGLTYSLVDAGMDSYPRPENWPPVVPENSIRLHWRGEA